MLAFFLSLFVFTINLVYGTKNSLLLFANDLLGFSLQPKVFLFVCLRVTLKSVKSFYICSFILIQTIASFFDSVCLCLCVLWLAFVCFLLFQ